MQNKVITAKLNNKADINNPLSLPEASKKNNGFIINSVHSTDGCYSYTKEIKNGICSISLGTEEAEALAMAMGE